MRIYFNLGIDSCWDEVHSGKSKAKRKLFLVEFSGGSREGPGAPPPLFLDQTERPHPFLPFYLMVFIRHWNGIFKYYEQDIKQFNFYYCCVMRLPSFSS